jgi:parallel beta-helix repeat protein
MEQARAYKFRIYPDAKRQESFTIYMQSAYNELHADDFNISPQPGADTKITPQPGAQYQQPAPAAPAPAPAPAAPPEERPEPQPQPAPKSGQEHAPMPGPEVHTVQKAKHLPIIAVAIIVVMLAAAIIVIKFVPHPVQTTSSTTTVAVSLNSVGSCENINSAGTYSLRSNITTSIESGACINIRASNVDLECNGHVIHGSGPYDGIPPFTYGININSSGVKVSGCVVGNFSYGVFVQPSSNVNVSYNNVSSNYMSDIYLEGVSNSSVSDNKLFRSTSNQSALHIANGSTNNIFYNNTILYNLHNGIFINSSGNSFLNNHINDSPSSLYCTPSGGIKKNNVFSGLCYNNTGCSFAYCKGYNIPTNLSTISLSSNITSCGAINQPGTYHLSSQINMNNYINVSELLGSTSQEPCIRIRANDVALDCGGKPITNSTIGILAKNKENITLNDCNLSTANVGILLDNTTDSHINGLTASGSVIGLELYNSIVDFVSNSTTDNNIYGIYMENSSTDTVSSFKANGNQYGLYVAGSLGNIFFGGQLEGNSKLDVYATINSANATYNLMSTTTCGVTDAAWAPCASHITSNLLFYPIKSCGVISRPGNYSLTASVSTTLQSCIYIKSSNVKLNCNGNLIDSVSGEALGGAVVIANESNVTVQGCNINNFNYGINATNVRLLNIINTSDNKADYGILLSNANDSFVGNNIIKNIQNYSIGLISVSNSIVYNNNFSYTPAQNSGLYLYNSRGNLVTNNIGSNNYIGISIEGESQNNTIYNNSVYASSKYDYACGAQDSGLEAENGGINTGSSKEDCSWLVELSPQSSLQCTAAFRPEDFSLLADSVYGFGTTCFNVYGNDTTINCNGHTIIATNGGTFLYAKGANNVLLENCYLKGFTSPVVAHDSNLSIINNTIDLNRTAPEGLSAINIFGTSNVKIEYNNISSTYYGLYLANDNYGDILHNIINGASTAYFLDNVSGVVVNGDTAISPQGIGIVLNDSTQNIFSNDNFSGRLIGFECVGSSIGRSADTDTGGNYCSSESSCTWVNKSSSTCAP